MPPAGPPPLPPPPKPPDPRRHRKTGDYDPDQYERCWDELPADGFDRRDLRFFACTLRTAGTHVRQMFGGGETPVEHLAVFPTAVAVLSAPPGRNVIIRRHPLGSLTWTFGRPKDSAAGFLAGLSDSRRADLADAVALTLSSAAGSQTLALRPGPATDELRELLPAIVLDRARDLTAKGRNVRAEDYLARIPAGTRAHAEAVRLRAEIGTLAAVPADHRQGLPGVASGVRGRLRVDARGIEFFDEAEGRSVRVPITHVKRILEVRKGIYPDEYTKRVQTQRKKVSAARFAFVDPLLYMGAQAAVASAKQDLADARFGQPLRNRLVLLVAIQGKAVPVIFDVAGADRSEVERAAGDFHVHLETLVPGGGPPAPAAVAGGFGWEPPGIRDRLTALRGANHLTGEDYGFLMTVLSPGGRPSAAGPPSARDGESKAPAIKIGVKFPDLPKPKSGGPPPVPKPAAPQPEPAGPTETVAHGPQPFADPSPDPATQPISAEQPVDESPSDLDLDLDLDLGPDLDLELGLDAADLDEAYDAEPDDLGGLDADYDPGLDAGFGEREFGTEMTEL